MARSARPSRQAASAARQTSEPVGFDFTGKVRIICEDMAARLPKLAHVDMRRVAVGFCQARKNVGHGLQASLTPMRFENGRRTTRRKGREYRVQQVHDRAGNEMLYVLSFYLPRFQNQPFREKLVTILHELWHISPNFDGDLRRLPGRCYVHSHSEKQYDDDMAVLADEWLAKDPPWDIHDFLRLSFAELQNHYGQIRGTRIAAPKLIAIDK